MIEQILVYKVVGEIELKHLYLVCHIGRINLLSYMYNIYVYIRNNPFCHFIKREQLLGDSLCGAQIP
jgi:hypothetical protein